MDQVRECIDISPKLDDTLSMSDLVIDESVHGESSGAVIKGGDIPLEDLKEFQCTPPCSQIPQVDPYANKTESHRKCIT